MEDRVRGPITRGATGPPWTPARVFAATLIVASVAAAIWLLYRFLDVWFGLFLAIVIASALRPAVQWLEVRGLGRGTAAGILCALFAALGTVVLVLVVPPLLGEVERMVRHFPDLVRQAQDALRGSPSRIVRDFGRAVRQAAGGQSPAPLYEAVGNGLGIARKIGDGVLLGLAVLLLSFLWLYEGDFILRRILFLVPPRHRDRARDLLGKAEEKLGAYARGQALLCGVVGALSVVAYLLIGVPYPLVLGVVAGLLEAVPLVGPWLGAVPALVVALATNPIDALWVAIAAIAIHAVEGYFLFPRVMSRAVGVNPVVTLLALVGFGSIFGVLGAIIALPLAAMSQLVLDEMLAQRRRAGTQSDSRASLTALEWEAETLLVEARHVSSAHRRGSKGEERPEESVESIADDLRRFVTEGAPSEAQR